VNGEVLDADLAARRHLRDGDRDVLDQWSVGLAVGDVAEIDVLFRSDASRDRKCE